MREGGIVFVLNFPPIDLLDNGMLHSGSPNASKNGFFNSTINTLLKLIPGLTHFSLLSESLSLLTRQKRFIAILICR